MAGDLEQRRVCTGSRDRTHWLEEGRFLMARSEDIYRRACMCQKQTKQEKGTAEGGGAGDAV